MLLVCSEMVESSYEPPDTDEDDEGSGSGGSGTPGGSSNGESDASGPGNEPQGQAITDAEPDSDELQGRQGLVEVSFDDIDDGPGELPGCPSSRVPQALRSRAGIMLDTAAMPPGLTPFVLADAAHIALQPNAIA